MTRPRIVVVNHDRVLLEIMQELLIDEGYDTVLCTGTDEAYARCQREQPDLLILDIRIGQEAVGWEVLDRVKLDPATTHLPAIVCSTDARLLAAKAAYTLSGTTF